MKRAFSLVELLVVIGIIAVLTGVLLTTMSGTSESARTAQCMSNLRNLATACQTYGQATGRYPLAGSIERMRLDESQGIAQAKVTYSEVPGWISWYSNGAYKDKPTSHMASSSWLTSMYLHDDKANYYCLTNGALYRYISGDHGAYVCPTHVTKQGKKGRPQWSYLMNAFFGWDETEGGTAKGENFMHIEFGRLKRADRVLLFSEVPFARLPNTGSWFPEGEGSGTECDCVLQYNPSETLKVGSHGANMAKTGSENIGFNHRSGKNIFANVVFADSHVEKLVLPKGGLSDTQIRQLTSWLCTGEDVSYDGRNYRRLEN